MPWMTGVMPRTSATVSSPVRGRLCGRWSSVAAMAAESVPGRSSPAMSLSRVLLPVPLGATRPVRPGPTVKERSWKTGVSSGQVKDRFEQTTEASDGYHPEMHVVVLTPLWAYIRVSKWSWRAP
ncbi:hypothetical protein BEK98_27170 [Streptomyces diastatochromogenes]|uniref:Uncharacterized protein n=1 Tax=Streptomyces diastatochromogenes TaxID=42236 RepID=A0A233S9X0_STRDA|nr:hypothetical protein BEK98_27170 [Streptomyces diastatochromogenes]